MARLWVHLTDDTVLTGINETSDIPAVGEVITVLEPGAGHEGTKGRVEWREWTIQKPADYATGQAKVICDIFIKEDN